MTDATTPAPTLAGKDYFTQALTPLPSPASSTETPCTCACGCGRAWNTRGRLDKYGRALATVRVAGHDLADELIRLGLGRRYQGGRRPTWCEK